MQYFYSFLKVFLNNTLRIVIFIQICFIKRYFKCKSMLRSIEVQDTKVGPPPKIAENHPIKESKSFDSLSGDCVTLHPESDSIPYKI